MPKMPQKQGKQIPATVPVVELDSSDDDDHQVGVSTATKAASKSGPLKVRSFWRAGAYEIGPTTFTRVEGDLEHARVHPKFLHSNATSHKWAFGAIAELLDNAVDEIVNGATFVKVDMIYNKKDHGPALLFQDDGGGMDPERIRKCMSLGYTSKTSNKAIGQYGNGFKTSTMRLGADAIVFSRTVKSGKATQSVGLLSYTFLRKTRQDDVIVPMIDFDLTNHAAEPIIYTSKSDWSSNLETILEWSPFASKDDLMLQFEDIGSRGTKIIIYNLWMNDEGVYELSFDDDDEDIKLRDEVNRGNPTPTKRVAGLQSHLSYHIRYSLRAYASILYLKKFTNFRIILRGKPVEQYSIADDLKHSKIITYRPYVGSLEKEVAVETIIGFIKEAPEIGVNGFNIYHRNRLIRPYWKVIGEGTSRGYGVVGVLEANFMEPAHDKQDFERSTLYLKLETRLKQMVSEYWKGHCHLVGHKPEGSRERKAHNKSNVQSYSQEVNEDLGRANIDHNSPLIQPILIPDDDSAPEPTEDAGSLDQICEENVHLFMRCEEYKERQVEMKREIEGLENELDAIKRQMCCDFCSFGASKEVKPTHTLR